MKFKVYIFWVFVIVIVTACIDNKEVYLSGNATNGEGDFLWIEEITPTSNIVIDSFEIDNTGQFEISIIADFPKLLKLKTADGQFVFLIVKPGEEVEISGDYDAIGSDYIVKGSYESGLIREYMKQFNFALAEKRKIANSFYVRTDAGEDVEAVRLDCINKHEMLKNEIVAYTLDFIEKYKCTLAAIFVLDLQLGPNDPILTKEKDLKYFHMVDSCLSDQMPELDIVQAFSRSLLTYSENQKMSGKTIGIGEMAPDIALPSINGDTIFLSAINANYILLDFWASWNKNCRKNNIALKEVYKNYNKKGFDIYQVSLDKSKASWSKAIAADSLQWTNVSDLMFWDSYLVNLYQVYNLPSNFLIDPNGLILAKNISVKELEALLDEKLN